MKAEERDRQLREEGKRIGEDRFTGLADRMTGLGPWPTERI